MRAARGGERAVGQRGAVRVDGAAAEELLVEGEGRVRAVGGEDFEDLGWDGVSRIPGTES